MAVQQQKPMRSVGIGALYQCFIDSKQPSGYEDTIYKSDSITKIGTSESRKATPVYASNRIYEEDIAATPATLAIEVVAFEPRNLARMYGNAVTDEGFVVHNRFDEGEYFALGVVYPKRHGHYKFIWYPKCLMVDSTKDHQTATEDGPNSQNRTINVQAYEFNDAGDWQIEYDTELIVEGGTRLTEEQFFGTVRTSPGGIEPAPEG